ncbi:MAG: T9SS type A sorting domain-containing protein, partial [Flavobacteriales bacterium]|nr:T9SS type A sorting domain-containing protein [Flavobacteriales bacterium]
GETITLTINTDDYGSETTWTIEAAGATLYSGGPYADVSGGEVHTAEFCLEEACFSFTIMDAVGDGICCAYGDGHYTITDSDGDVLLDGNGSFGTSATNTFCTGFAHVQEFEESPFQVFPDPSAGPVNVVFHRMEDSVTIIIRDMVGRELQRVRATTTYALTLDLAALPDGRYLLDAMTSHQRSVRVVTIGR